MKINIYFSIACMLLFSNMRSQNKPNILFIFADDQTFESINSLNNKDIRTPNLDKLVDQGVVFTHAFNQGAWQPAVCVSSRLMLNTGSFIWRAARYNTHANNFVDKNSGGQALYNIPQKKPDAYWSNMMKAAGYETYMTGKWHVSVDVTSVFDHTVHIRAGMPNQTKERYQRAFIKDKPDIWSPYDKSRDGYWKGGKHWSEVVADDAISFLDKATTSTKPFFMYLAFNAPHDPRQSPKRFVDMYPEDKISIPKSFIPEYPYAEAAASGRGLRDEQLAPFPRTAYSVKINRQEYYAIITHMDEQIGRILEALEKSGKMENTYIIFTADHGLAVGDHGFIGKQNLYDRSIRVPLILNGPNIPKSKKVDKMVYLQDVMATSLDLADMKKKNQVDFNSLMPLALGKKKKSKYKAVYGAYLSRQRMIRTEDFKMIIYPSIHKVRLYNIKNDPDELVDLAGDEAYQKKLKKLFKKLFKLQKEVGDQLDLTEVYDGIIN